MKLEKAQVLVMDGMVKAVMAMSDPPSERELIAIAVRLTVEAIGFHVARDGEICDPRPEERFMPPGQEAKWGGGSRRARRRR